MSTAYHLVRFEGWIDVSRYLEFRGAFMTLPPLTPVLIDLTDVEGADSIFLSEMLLARRRHDAPFAVLIPPEGPITKLFELTSLGTKVDVYRDLSSAVAALGVAKDRNRLSADLS